MSGDLQRELGKLQSDVEHLQGQVDSMQKDIRAIRDAALSVRGGWKTIVLVGSVGAAISAFVLKVLPFVK